jgi:hypothetical protein
MSFQAYLDNVKAKTGKSPEDFKKLAAQKGLTKHGDIMAWLKADFALGHGHANAITHVILRSDEPAPPLDDQIAKHFSGGKAGWRKAYDGLMGKLEKFGSDITVSPTKSYISILRNNKKFAIVQVTSDRLDIGIKLKDAPSERRFEESGAWNAMVTHRVRITDAKQMDAELIAWLRQAYDKA